MPTLSKPRAGSLQFWPRSRASDVIPRVNWSAIPSQKDEGLLGFIGYKVGMLSVLVKDTTDKSMTSGKKIYIPATVLEVPPLKIASVRFYFQGQVVKDVIVSQDKELKKIMKLPKKTPALDAPKNYDDIRVLVYSLVDKTNLKKTPDIAELALHASDKLTLVKSLIGKELSVKELAKSSLVDVRGLTKGKGFSGALKRFHIALKQHKSEKGRRRPGSLAPWHPARVTFRTPMAGQLGMFTRIHYNQKVISLGNIAEKDINRKGGFTHYGTIKSGYIILQGSVQGPPKRQLLLTPSLRPTKKQLKKKFELQEIVA